MKRVLGTIGILLVVLTLAAVVGPFVIPVPPLEATRPPEELADADSQFMPVNGVQIHYKRTGEGEPVFILLHGFLASLHSWREVMGPLGESGTVIAYDRPAFGLTSRPMPEEWGEENPYTAQANVEMLIGLMDALAVERAVLVGNSAGGSLAIHAALQHPERIRGLILVDAAVYTGGGTPDWMHPVLATPQMRRIGPLLLRNIRGWGEDFGRMAWHDPGSMTPDVWEGYLRPLQAENWDRALWEFLLASRPLDLEARLDEIRVPVLVITGDDDRIVPTQESIRLAEAIPGSDLVVIADCGHLPQEERPQAFLQAVRGFIANLEASAGSQGWRTGRLPADV